MKFFKLLITSIFLTLTVNYLEAQCLEVNSIFVNSCGPTEGENEMFTFQTGTSALNVNDISVNWPNPSNSFLGWCQDAATATATASLNATILTSCGWLLEPTGGVIPAGSDVIVITSTNISIADNSFEGLADTMYIVYQCAGNTAGHFANSFSGSRTLQVLVSGPCVQIENVTYDGSIANADGATALFDNAGNVSYTNNGCNAPVITLSAGWSFTDIICNDYGNVDLNTLLAPNATLGGTWSGPRVSGSTYNSGSYLGLDSITYSVANPGGCSGSLDSTIVFLVDTPATGNESLQSCDSLNYNGVWYTSNIIINDSTIAVNPFYCDSFFTVDITITSAIRDSSYFEACSSFTFNGNTYTNDTILYDTLRAGGSSGGNSCTELFISEYGEGSSSNKYIEIYNGTGVPVDLSTYSIANFNNGATAAGTTEILSGILADGDVFVITSLGADAAIAAETDLYSNALFINGDDALALYNNGNLIDLIGNIGCDPGSNWTSGSLSTENQTLVRNASYTSGITVDPANTPCDFPTLNTTNWTNLGIDTWTNLGTHTATCSGAAVSGCDTVVVTEIKINNITAGNLDTTICNGASFVFNGTTYNGSNLTGTETLIGAASGGCDSVVTVTVTELAEIIGTSTSVSCDPADVGVNQTGPFVSVSGCDSIHYDTVSLASSIPGNLDTTICNGDSFVFNGTTYNGSNLTGTETLIGAASGGCDSVVTVTVTELAEIIGTSTSVSCDPADVGVNQTGPFVSVSGCDSIHYDTVSLASSIPGNLDTTICNGASFVFNGTTYNGSNLTGTETLVGAALGGCDSVVTVTVTELAEIIGTSTSVSCDPADVGVNQTGPFVSVSGCDSTHYDTVSLAPSVTGNLDTTICNGDSFVFNGTTYSDSNLSGVDTLFGAASGGCDSIVMVTVSLLDSISNVNIVATDTSIEVGQTVNIVANANNVQTYEWSPISAFTNEFDDTPLTTTTYIVTLRNGPCPSVIDSITIVVSPVEDYTPQMPTAFSPNNDGINDVFRPANFEQYENYMLKIYDRWGNLIFNERGFGVAWDGSFKNKLQNIGVYLYYLEAKPLNPLSKEKVSSGNFTLIR